MEKTEKGVRVRVKGRPETEEVIPLSDLEASINKAAYACTAKHLGPREEIGNQGGSLSNRVRAALAGSLPPAGGRPGPDASRCRAVLSAPKRKALACYSVMQCD